MEETDLTKLRRFSLSCGLILIALCIAGVELNAPIKIEPMGIPLIVKRPDAIGWGLVLGSLYSCMRYWFYATMTRISYKKARKLLLSGKLVTAGQRKFEQIGDLEKEAKNDIIKILPQLFME